MNQLRTNALFLVVLAFAVHENVRCTQMPNVKSDSNEKVEDWDDIKNEVCKKEQSSDVQDQIEKCNQLDPFYKLDSFWRECSKLQAPGGSNWYNNEKGQCKVQECYEAAGKTSEYTKINDEIDKMDEKVKVEKAYKKYLCIRKVLGLKV